MIIMLLLVLLLFLAAAAAALVVCVHFLCFDDLEDCVCLCVWLEEIERNAS